MTSVSSTASSSSTSSATKSLTSSATIAGNFDTFLKLLTTQLKNQDPSSPLDTNQFTQQLVQFSSVEQQLKSNDLLTTLVKNANTGTAASAAGYLGATITADGSKATLSDGQAKWSWNAARAASKATITIQDASGATVYSKTASIDAGDGSFTWDGRSTDGALRTSGNYTLKIDATDASGSPVTVSTSVSGKVDSVDLSGSEPVLTLGTTKVPLSSVKTLSRL